MKNNFINNNGAILHNTKKSPKTKVESRIEKLKQQEQEIISELKSWETKNKELDKLLANLTEVNKFSTEFLTELVKTKISCIKRGLKRNKKWFCINKKVIKKKKKEN